jgi:hypothetical protein
MNFEMRMCPKINAYCRGTRCVQFASCMIFEIEAMEDLGINSSEFQTEVVKAIEESLL